MTSLTVLESSSESISLQIASRLSACPDGGAILLISAQPPAPVTKLRPDVLVVSPASAATLAKKEKLHCGTLLVPGGARIGGIDAGCVVSYGMNPKDTVTYSSIGEDECILSLQRELVTVSGTVLERQEFAIKRGGPPQESLAALGALLLLGIAP